MPAVKPKKMVKRGVCCHCQTIQDVVPNPDANEAMITYGMAGDEEHYVMASHLFYGVQCDGEGTVPQKLIEDDPSLISMNDLFIRFADDNRYRLAMPADIRSGAEMIMVIIPLNESEMEHIFSVGITVMGTKIKFDENPLRNGTVYYHCIYPAWSKQCFVPLSDIIDQIKKRDQCGPYLTTIYLISLE